MVVGLSLLPILYDLIISLFARFLADKMATFLALTSRQRLWEGQTHTKHCQPTWEEDHIGHY